MAKNDEQELYILTEVGTFGELNLTDPTKKKVKTNIEDDIQKAVAENLNNLTK